MKRDQTMNELSHPVVDHKNPDYERMLRRSGAIAINEPLAPVDYCLSVMSEEQEPPCGLKRGKELAIFLVGSYPENEIPAPDIYARVMRVVFAEFSQAVGQRAIDRLLLRLKRPPSGAHVHEACDEIAGVERMRRNRAKRMLAEHDRRKREEDRNALIEKERSDPDIQAGATERFESMRAIIVEGRSVPKPSSRARVNRGPDPAEADQAEHARLHQQLMEKLKADGLPIEPLEPGERPQ
jgi:hypothetical protein